MHTANRLSKQYSRLQTLTAAAPSCQNRSPEPAKRVQRDFSVRVPSVSHGNNEAVHVPQKPTAENCTADLARSKLSRILQQASSICELLPKPHSEHEDLSQIADRLCYFFDYMVREQQQVKQKYKQLLETHSGCGAKTAVPTKGQQTTGEVTRLEAENARLRNALTSLVKDKMYL